MCREWEGWEAMCIEKGKDGSVCVENKGKMEGYV